MDTTVQYRYITSSEKILGDEPIIRDTRISVRAIVETWCRGVAPEEIPLGFPSLTPAQVFEALSYYSDNQAEINEYIEKNRVPKEILHPLLKDL